MALHSVLPLNVCKVVLDCSTSLYRDVIYWELLISYSLYNILVKMYNKDFDQTDSAVFVLSLLLVPPYFPCIYDNIIQGKNRKEEIFVSHSLSWDVELSNWGRIIVQSLASPGRTLVWKPDNCYQYWISTDQDPSVICTNVIQYHIYCM